MLSKDKLAVEECLVLWKYLALSGKADKEIAVSKLHAQGRLSRDCYVADCPLCQAFNCFACPWRTVPNKNDKCTGCMYKDSPFILWTKEYSKSRKNRQQAASAVYKFLKQIKK